MQSVMCSKSRLNAEAIQFGRSALLLASDIGYAVKHVYPPVMVYIDDVCVIGWTFYSARCSMKKDTGFPRVIHRRVYSACCIMPRESTFPRVIYGLVYSSRYIYFGGFLGCFERSCRNDLATCTLIININHTME